MCFLCKVENGHPNRALVDCWHKIGQSFLVELTKLVSQQSSVTFVPTWWHMKYKLLMKGPHDLSNDLVDNMIQDLVMYGVCEQLDLGNAGILYTGLAGLLSRFVQKNIQCRLSRMR